MPSPEDHLARWRAAGLIDQDQADRILAFEAARERGPARPAGEQLSGDQRPGVLEAILYLGIVVASVGIITLIANNWDDLTGPARIAALWLPSLLLALAGFGLRSLGSAAMGRAAGLAWLAAVALLAGGVGVVGAEADWDGDATVLLAGAAATAAALAFWVLGPSHPQVIALAGALVLLAVGASTRAEHAEAETFGLVLVLFGAAGVAVAERGWFGPRLTARLLSAAGVVAGLLMAAYAGEWQVALFESLVFVVGAALLWLGLRRAAFTYVVVGVGGVFLGLIFFIFRHFEDELGAPVALLLSGALIVGAALLLALARRRLVAEPEA